MTVRSFAAPKRSGAYILIGDLQVYVIEPDKSSFVVSEKVFSEELEKFIAAEINSLEQLEILLLLSGNPHKWWTPNGVYEVIKSSVQSVQDRLEEMVGRGILRKEAENEVRYQFGPMNDDVWRVTSELRDAYKERSVKVVQAIYSKPPDAVQEFARAFRLRRDT